MRVFETLFRIIFEIFFDNPLGAVDFFSEVRLRSERCRAFSVSGGLGASIFEHLSTSGGFGVIIFEHFSTSGGFEASIFDHFRRQEAPQRAFSSVFEASSIDASTLAREALEASQGPYRNFV